MKILIDKVTSEQNLHESFLKNFFRQIDFLETTPLSFQKRYRDIRILAFDDFNYSIHFIVQKDTVQILRILNQKQDF